MDVYEVVEKLIGEIKPVGETCEDDRRFENLKRMTELIDKLLTDIDDIAHRYKDSYEYSVKKASEFASKFQDSIGIVE